VSVPDPQPPEPGPPRRYRPSTIGGLLYLVALVGVLVGLGVAVGDWRAGVRWIGASLVFAAGCRLAVPTDQAGMLAVRHRLVDATGLSVVGVLLILLAGDIPDQPPLP
jgi:hypothetical protein